ncbi:MAG: hypothetical protein OXU65_05245, partial [Deltaproteobacteria bacterium]|nr:hypothetical protein [Deltaproteobacteria bacterium]
MDTGNTRRARRAFGTRGAVRAFTTTVAGALTAARGALASAARPLASALTAAALRPLTAALRPIAGARGVGRALAGALLVGGVLGLAQG